MSPIPSVGRQRIGVPSARTMALLLVATLFYVVLFDTVSDKYARFELGFLVPVNVAYVYASVAAFRALHKPFFALGPLAGALATACSAVGVVVKSLHAPMSIATIVLQLVSLLFLLRFVAFLRNRNRSLQA